MTASCLQNRMATVGAFSVPVNRKGTMQITTTEYNEMRDKIAKLTADLDTLTKERDQIKSHKDMYYESDRRAQADLARVHTFLSALPDPPPEKPEGANTYDPPLPVPERLAIWLAKRMK